MASLAFFLPTHIPHSSPTLSCNCKLYQEAQLSRTLTSIPSASLSVYLFKVAKLRETSQLKSAVETGLRFKVTSKPSAEDSPALIANPV